MQATVTIKPLPSPHAQDAGREPKTFTVEGIDIYACRRKALDLYGDYCEVAHYEVLT